MLLLMTMLLIGWVCASIVLCLAFLSMAARQVPHMDEHMATGRECALRQEAAIALENVTADFAPSWSRIPLPAIQAKPKQSMQVQPDESVVSFPSLPVSQPGMRRSRFSPRWHGGNTEDPRLETGAAGVRNGARPGARNVPRRQTVDREERVELIGAIYDQV